MKIGICAGHCVQEPGAKSETWNINEQWVCRLVCLNAAVAMRDEGIEVFNPGSDIREYPEWTTGRSGRTYGPKDVTLFNRAGAYRIRDLDLILDGGATTLQQASTVLRVAEDGVWQILRRGSITEEMIQRTLGRTIVFVCTANSCRSPMAEVLCKQLLAERLGCSPYGGELEARGYSVVSAGTAAMAHCPASRQAIEAMRRRGLDLTRHGSRPITPGLVEDADLIFVMARHHADSILHIMPEAEAKVRLLDEHGDDIADPVGGSVDLFVACANDIERAIRAQLSTL